VEGAAVAVGGGKKASERATAKARYVMPPS
jgi:hypothetical protein